MPRLKKERYEKIMEDYLSGMTQKETGEANDIGRDAVGNILRRFDVPVRSYTGKRQDVNRKWYWDFDFFKKRDSIIAYWAGFVMADGSISKSGKSSSSLNITIHKDDENHLKVFCDEIGLDYGAIYHMILGVGDTPCVAVNLSYPDLMEDLEPWGVIPRKSYNFREPEVPDELLFHYLRGWADGDGHIYRYGSNVRFTVSGNIPSLRWYGNALERIGYSGNWQIQERNENTGILYIGGRLQATEVIELLDVDNEFCMRRKWNKKNDSKREMYDVVCENCEKEFKVPKYKYENPKHGRFCSRSCSSSYISNQD